MDMFDKIFSVVPINQANSLAERRGDWSDNVPLDMAKKHPFAYCVSDPTWLTYFLTDWYNFYYGSVLSQELTPYEMIVKALSLASAPINGRKLVSIWAYTGSAANWYNFEHPPNDGKLMEDHKPAELDETYLAILAKTVPEGELKKKLHKSSEEEHNSFRSWYIARLIDVSNGSMTGFLQVCNVVSFMAAVALRALAKDSDQLLASYLKSNFQENCKKVAFIHANLQIPAPHKGFITRVESCLARGATNSKVLLAHFLTLLLAEELSQFEGTSIDIVKTFIKSSALTHLEHNGLSVCALFVQVLHAFSTSPQDLACSLKSGTLKTSPMAVGSALGKYQKCRTWGWSRVYDDGYLPEMRSDRHSMLIAILSEMLIHKAPDTHQGIMESRAVRKMSSADQWAAKMYAESVIVICYSFESEVANSAVAARFQEKKAEHEKPKEEDPAASSDPRTNQLVKDLLASLKTNTFEVPARSPAIPFIVDPAAEKKTTARYRPQNLSPQAVGRIPSSVLIGNNDPPKSNIRQDEEEESHEMVSHERETGSDEDSDVDESQVN